MAKYKRILLKISGEALKGNASSGIDPQTINNFAEEIKSVKDQGVEVGIVVGGGNIWRGKTAEGLGMDRAQADQMGMLATIMNGLAVQDALEKIGVTTRVMSAVDVTQVCEPYIRRRAIRHLEKDRVVIFVGGIGSPYFSTDTTAALRAAEINAEIVLMAKNGVDGVYDKDPKKYADAKLFSELSFSKILELGLQVMDSTAASLFRDNKMSVLLFNMNKQGNILKASTGEQIGTIIK